MPRKYEMQKAVSDTGRLAVLGTFPSAKDQSVHSDSTEPGNSGITVYEEDVDVLWNSFIAMVILEELQADPKQATELVRSRWASQNPSFVCSDEEWKTLEPSAWESLVHQEFKARGVKDFEVVRVRVKKTNTAVMDSCTAHAGTSWKALCSRKRLYKGALLRLSPRRDEAESCHSVREGRAHDRGSLRQGPFLHRQLGPAGRSRAYLRQVTGTAWLVQSLGDCHAAAMLPPGHIWRQPKLCNGGCDAAAHFLQFPIPCFFRFSFCISASLAAHDRCGGCAQGAAGHCASDSLHWRQRREFLPCLAGSAADGGPAAWRPSRLAARQRHRLTAGKNLQSIYIITKISIACMWLPTWCSGRVTAIDLEDGCSIPRRSRFVYFAISATRVRFQVIQDSCAGDAVSIPLPAPRKGQQ
jgi:hypothetical protein